MVTPCFESNHFTDDKSSFANGSAGQNEKFANNAYNGKVRDQNNVLVSGKVQKLDL